MPAKKRAPAKRKDQPAQQPLPEPPPLEKGIFNQITNELYLSRYSQVRDVKKIKQNDSLLALIQKATELYEKPCLDLEVLSVTIDFGHRVAKEAFCIIVDPAVAADNKCWYLDDPRSRYSNSARITPDLKDGLSAVIHELLKNPQADVYTSHSKSLSSPSTIQVARKFNAHTNCTLLTYLRQHLESFGLDFYILLCVKYKLININFELSTAILNSKFFDADRILESALRCGKEVFASLLKDCFTNPRFECAEEDDEYFNLIHKVRSYLLSNQQRLDAIFKICKEENNSEINKAIDDAFFGAIEQLNFVLADKILDRCEKFQVRPYAFQEKYILEVLEEIITKSGDLKLIKKFIAISKPNLNCAPEHSVLIEAYNHIKENKLEVLEALLKAGADPNLKLKTRDPEIFSTILVECTLNKDVQIAELLIKYGADVNFAQRAEGSPSAIAIAFGNEDRDMIRLLLKSGSSFPIAYNPHKQAYYPSIGMDTEKREYLIESKTQDTFFKQVSRLLFEFMIFALEELPPLEQPEHSKVLLPLEDAATETTPSLTEHTTTATLDAAERVVSVSASRDLILTLSGASQALVQNLLTLYKKLSNTSTIDTQIKSILFEILSNNGSQAEKQELLSSKLSELSTNHSEETSAAIIAIAHSLDQKIIGDPKDFIRTLATDPHLVHQYFQGQLKGILEKEQSSVSEEITKWTINGQVITPSTPHVYKISSSTKDQFYVHFTEEIWDSNESLLSTLNSMDLRFIARGSEGTHGVKLSKTNIAKLKLTNAPGGDRFTSDMWLRNPEGATLIVFNKMHGHDYASKYSRKTKGEVLFVPHDEDGEDTEQPSTSGNDGNEGGGGGAGSVSGKTASCSPKDVIEVEVSLGTTSPAQKEDGLSSEEESSATTLVAHIQGISVSTLKHILQNNDFMSKTIKKIIDVLTQMHKSYSVADKIAEFNRCLKMSVQEKALEDTQKSEEEGSQPPLATINSGSSFGHILPQYEDPLNSYLAGKHLAMLSD